MSGNQLGRGRRSYFPARDGCMNHYQVMNAVGDPKIWKIQLMFQAPSIMAKEDYYGGPDEWNRGENIFVEPGRPSHMVGNLFPWPEGTHSRYKLNTKGDGFVFDMEGPELDPPRGLHNPVAEWKPDLDPFRQPSEGFGVIANPGAYQYWEDFWLPTGDALILIEAMKLYAQNRRARWARIKPRKRTDAEQIRYHQSRINSMNSQFANADDPRIIGHLRSRIDGEKSAIERLELKISETTPTVKIPSKTGMQTEQSTKIVWKGYRGNKFRGIHTISGFIPLGLHHLHKTGGITLAPGNRIKIFGKSMDNVGSWTINGVYVNPEKSCLFCSDRYKYLLSEAEFDRIQRN